MSVISDKMRASVTPLALTPALSRREREGRERENGVFCG